MAKKSRKAGHLVALPGAKHDRSGASAGAQINRVVSELNGVLLATAARIPEATQAEDRLRRLLAAAYGVEHGADMRRLEELDTRLSDDIAVDKAELDGLRAQRLATPEFVPSCRENRDKEEADYKEVPPWRWQLRHQIAGFVLFLLLVFALLASLISAYFNIIGTELPVFSDNPILAWSMAAIAPMSAIALKCIGMNIHNPIAHCRFIRVILIATAVSVASWIVLFAQNYHGLSTELSLGGLLDAPSALSALKDTAFVGAALCTEIFAGALMALTLGNISSNYAPDYTRRNETFERLSVRIDMLEDDVATKSQLAEDVKAARQAHTDTLNLTTEVALLALEGRRTRASEPSL